MNKYTVNKSLLKFVTDFGPLAIFLYIYYSSGKDIKVALIPFIIALIPALIVLNQPDLGTALVMISPVIPMLYWVGARPFHLFLVIAPLLSILTAANVIAFTIWTTLMGLIIFLSKPKLWNGIAIFFSNIFLGLIFPNRCQLTDQRK